MKNNTKVMRSVCLAACVLTLISANYKEPRALDAIVIIAVVLAAISVIANFIIERRQK